MGPRERPPARVTTEANQRPARYVASLFRRVQNRTYRAGITENGCQSYAAVGGPNQVVSALGSPRSMPSPTQATYPSGRINTAVGSGDRAEYRKLPRAG